MGEVNVCMDRTRKLESISGWSGAWRSKRDLLIGGANVMFKSRCICSVVVSVRGKLQKRRQRLGNATILCSYHTCQMDPTDLSLGTKPKQLSTPNLKSKVDLLGILTKSLCPLLQLVDTRDISRHSSHLYPNTHDLLPRIPPPQCFRSSSDFSR
jgi:hypothetical protein